jgi:uncharacterized protein YjbJ (UPF0337 family)
MDEQIIDAFTSNAENRRPGMAGFKRKYKNVSDRFSGKAKEIAGKVTNNEQLELKGKMQAAKADLNESMSIENKVEEIKENIAEKINDKIDENRKLKNT